MRIPRVVYAIQHNVTKRIYIGSTSNLEARYQGHIKSLRSGKHNIPDMQEDFVKFGEDYSLYILANITKYEDRFREFELIQEYKTYIRAIGYNYKDRLYFKWANKMNFPLKSGTPTPLPFHE